MTRNDIRQLVALRLGNRTDLDDAIDLHIRLAQPELEKMEDLPWFLAAASTLTLTQDVEYVDVPTGFLREYEADSFKLYDASGTAVRRLEKADYEDLVACWGDATGSPRGYALVGNRFYFRPIPDAAYTVKTMLYFKEDELSTDTSNNWTTETPMLMVAEVGKMVSQYVQNNTALQGFMALAQEARQNLLVANQGREMANREDSFGGGE